MRFKAAIAGILFAIPLAGCQTTQESAASAQMTCDAQGMRPGTERYRRCVAATYQTNRQQSQDAANATTAAVAAGVIGGAVLGAAAAGPGYGYGYRRCGYYGCW